MKKLVFFLLQVSLSQRKYFFVVVFKLQYILLAKVLYQNKNKMLKSK